MRVEKSTVDQVEERVDQVGVPWAGWTVAHALLLTCCVPFQRMGSFTKDSTCLSALWPHQPMLEIAFHIRGKEIRRQRKRRQSGSIEPQVPSTTKQGQKGLVGIWRVARSTRLQDLTVRSVLVFNRAPSGQHAAAVLLPTVAQALCHLTALVLCVVPCLLRNTWCEQEEEGEEKNLEVVLRQPIITSYVHVDQACFARAFAKSFCDHSSSSIMAFSLHVRDDAILAA
eukprot:1154220-Pelagomonas_calceolata.AAC.3